MRRIVLILLFIGFALRSIAAGSDTTYTDRNRLYQNVTYFYDTDYKLSSGKDTISNSLDFFHQYNPVLKNDVFYKYLGNLGTAYQSMLYRNPMDFGLNTGLFDYDLYQVKPNSIKYYTARKRFTDLSYVLGAQLEQKFKITHTQNVNQYFNFGFDFQRISSDAFYSNFNTEYSNASGFMNAHSKNNRYKILANVIWNNLDVGQNGGLVHDSVLEFTPGIDNLLYPINSKDARTKNRNKSAYIKQSFDFGYHVEKKINDSTTTRTFKPSAGIFHSIAYEDRSYAYQETDLTSSYYQKNYYDTVQTKDSIYNRKLENRFALFTLENYKGNPESVRKFNAFLMAGHQLLLYKQRAIDTIMNAVYLKGAIYSSAETRLRWDLNGSYNVLGANKKDYIVNGTFRYDLGTARSNYIALTASNQKRSPAFIYNKFDSNHFIWNNQLEKSALSSTFLSYHFPKYHFDIEFGYTFMKNYLYFGSDSLPKQQIRTININQLVIHKDFRWYKFVLANRLAYQKASRQDIHVPKLASNHSLYFENKFFKKALLLQVGADARYNSSYYSDGYIPATGQFFLQSAEQVGNKVYLDVFVNFQIKTARFFIKMENVNGPTSGYTTNMVPSYPIPARAFKFGIIWQFFD